MCNHYRMNPEAIPSWREYIGAAPHEGEWSEIKIDIWLSVPYDEACSLVTPFPSQLMELSA